MTVEIASLHYLFSFDNRLGGAIHAALNVCKYLAISGAPTEALAPYFAGEDHSQLKDLYSDFRCHRVAGCPPKQLWNSREVTGWIAQNSHRFSIVELHGIWSLATTKVARACVASGIPYLVRPHGSLDPFDLQKKVWLKRLLGPLLIKKMLQQSAGVVCTAALEAERLVTYGASTAKYVMPLPVPLIETAGNRDNFRRKHGIPLDAQVVLFLSRIDYKKGLNFLIPALGKLKTDFPNLWFVLAGTGTDEYVSKVDTWIADNGIRSWTSQVGFVFGQDKQDAFAASDLFALPSLNENFGIVNIEAMHAGLPLVISDQVYIHREIEEASAGMICQPSTSSVIAVMRRALKEPDFLQRMGQAGANLVQERYRPDAATQTLKRLYETIVSKDQASSQKRNLR